jgi:TIR domain-containing protein
LPKSKASEGETRFIFISHTAVDDEFIKREILPITNSLYLASHFANYSTSGSELYRQAISRSLGRCAWFLIVISPASILSKWVQFEVSWARENRKRKRIIPILIEPCDPSKLHPKLSKMKIIDYLIDPLVAGQQIRAAFPLR